LGSGNTEGKGLATADADGADDVDALADGAGEVVGFAEGAATATSGISEAGARSAKRHIEAWLNSAGTFSEPKSVFITAKMVGLSYGSRVGPAAGAEVQNADCTMNTFARLYPPSKEHLDVVRTLHDSRAGLSEPSNVAQLEAVIEVQSEGLANHACCSWSYPLFSRTMPFPVTLNLPLHGCGTSPKQSPAPTVRPD